jgi:PPOX class probable F420-dependent enzyme
MSIADEKYLALTTFTKDGRRKSTPIWIAPLVDGVDGDVGFTTGSDAWKLRRLRNDPRCELQPCNNRGVVTEGSIVVTGTGRETEPGELADVQRAIGDKYGLQVTMIRGVQKLSGLIRRQRPAATTGIVITLD